MLVKDEQEYLTSEEVAKRLRVEHDVVTRWLRQGRLAGYKFGKQWRVRVDEFEKFVEERRNVGDEPRSNPDTDKFQIVTLPSFEEEARG